MTTESTHRDSYFPLHTLLALSGMQEAEIRSEHYVVWEKSDYKENHACSSPHNIYFVRPCHIPLTQFLMPFIFLLLFIAREEYDDLNLG